MCLVLCGSKALFSLANSCCALEHFILAAEQECSSDTVPDEQDSFIRGGKRTSCVRNLHHVQSVCDYSCLGSFVLKRKDQFSVKCGTEMGPKWEALLLHEITMCTLFLNILFMVCFIIKTIPSLQRMADVRA